MSDTLKLAIIMGSTRVDRFCPVPTNWFAEQAKIHGSFDTDIIDLIETEFPLRLSAENTPSLAALSSRLEAADAFVVVTPEYNHSFPGPLKIAIDHFNAEWHAKPVGLISYGGMAGGQRAAEGLRLVFPELNAITIRNTLSFNNFWEKFDEQGNPVDAEAANTAAKGFLDQLCWWATTLKSGRDHQPFGS
ncbi:NADPH-dependent FMN reductase [Natronoglycomyces albus]|uniref:NAD(P)H-dependent oxidoreductase n=1 Tax=Natronoglycomyces albus TaxID=2811108 RepID=A0A895XUQ9_9ACTN|nr:NAD(P)H-dependent oxidoreductase [Natronoglycomyces albus]QSB05388.1 NAD(P)H-dependent oxidoreductase [Natronoglycomyces albus]